MKFLIFGIDGGTKRILDAFEMPFTKSIFEHAVHRETDEDLFSRGWAEMVTGQHASQTRGFYMGPLMDGSHSFSVKYKTSEAEENNVLPIWGVAENGGARVGIMNIPTTSPARKVNGFMVGSGGGGVHKVTGIPKELVYPESAREFLESQNYIVDIRFTTSGIKNIETLFEQLALKERRRTDAYIELCKQHKVDFGFLVDRATTIVQYLCMSEIETRIATLSLADQFTNPGNANNTGLVHDLLSEFYLSLDTNIKKLMEHLQPENWLITADHSTVPYKFKANMAPFLEKHGYLCQRKTAGPIVGTLKNSIRRWLPRKYKRNIRERIPTTIALALDNVNWKKTRAFGHNYINGIYLNDARFGGPVTESQRESLVNEICELFNHEQEAIDRGIKARPYRDTFEGTRYQSHLPDVILDKPDELHVVGTGDFIYHNPNYGPLPDLERVKEDMFTGQKGRNPIFVMNQDLFQFVKNDDPNDLTLAYILTQRIFGHQ